jgi:hypothetical protein
MHTEIPSPNGHFTAEADAEALRVRPGGVARPARQRRGHTSTAVYLGGGLPLAWLARTARLRHKAFQVAVMLWHLRILQKAGSSPLRGPLVVRLEPKQYARFGLHRNTVHRALAAMAAQGLVEVRQEPGYPSEVTLLLR